MNWKSWPYWVKGGMTGLCAGILIDDYLLFNLETFFYNQPTCLAIGLCDGYVLPSAVIYVVLIALLVGFSLAGAGVGYLYGKFKNRKKLST